MDKPVNLSPSLNTYQGLFLPATAGHLYLGCYGELSGRRVWLYLPPFAEEMNLSRAIVSRQARAFVERGDAVVCLDYFGTGDSEGEFEQASVSRWLQDVSDCVAWLRTQGVASVNLWGLRLGGLLALRFIADNPEVAIRQLLLWKPVLDGKLLMGQFFRLKQVSESMKGGAKVNWIERVRQGETVEVAGYPMSPALLGSIEPIKLAALSFQSFPQTHWVAVGSDNISPAIAKVMPLWEDAKLNVQPCAGSNFWQNPDCYQAPELLQQTLAMTHGVVDV